MNATFIKYFTFLFIGLAVFGLISSFIITFIKFRTITVNQKAIYYVYILEKQYINIQLSNMYKFYTKILSKYLLERNTAVSHIFNPLCFEGEEAGVERKTEVTILGHQSIENYERTVENTGLLQNKSELGSVTKIKETLFLSGDKGSYEKFMRKTFFTFMKNDSYNYMMVITLVLAAVSVSFFILQRQMVHSFTSAIDLTALINKCLEKLYKVNVVTQELVYETYDNTKYLYSLYAAERIETIEAFYQLMDYNRVRPIKWFSSYHNYISAALVANYTASYPPTDFYYILGDAIEYLEKGLKNLFMSSLTLADNMLTLKGMSTTTLKHFLKIDALRLDLLSIIDAETANIIDAAKKNLGSITKIFAYTFILMFMLFMIANVIVNFYDYVTLRKSINRSTFLAKNVINLVPYRFAKASKAIGMFISTVPMTEFKEL